MKVFVTDGDNRAALAVTRSLGRAGHQVIVGEKHTPSLAQASRYCSARVTYPDPVTMPDEFVEFLVAEAAERRIDVLIPVADITTFLVTAERDRFPRECEIPFADAEIVARAADKVDMVHTAERLGVAVPRSVVVTDADSIPEHDLGYPVVIKPWKSRIRTPEGWVSTSVSYASDRDQLQRDLRSRAAHNFPVMLQERVVGPGIGVFACYHEGKPIAMFGHRRLKERPPWGGVSVLSESVEVDPVAGEFAKRLLDDLHWRGVAMVEFKRDLRDNLPKLMEINGRFWGSLQLAIDAGVDFPRLLVATAQHNAIAPQSPYRVGVRNRWLWGDFDSLLLTLFRQNGSPADRISRVRTIAQFMQVWGRDLHYDNPKPDDFKPWFLETRRRFQTVGRAVATLDRHPGNGHVRALARPLHIRARIASTLEATGLDAARWNALAAQSSTNSVFQTFEWAQNWSKTYGASFEALFVSVSDRSGIAGVAPFVIDRSSSRDRIVRFLGDGRSDYCDLLGASGSVPVVTAMFDAIRDAGGWDVIAMNNVPAQSPTVDVVRSVAEKAGLHISIDHQFMCPTLLIEGHEADAKQIFNKPSLRRPSNHFAKAGRLVTRNLTKASEVEPYLDVFFNQHIARWRGTRSPSLFLTERNRLFYRELTRDLAAKGWLLFSVVELDDQPIAFHYGFDYNGSITWYKPSFDPAQSAKSPGLVMVRHLIGHAIEQKRRELDFTVGDEPFKRRFTNATRTTVTIHVFRDPVRYMVERSRRRLTSTVSSMKRWTRS